MKIDKKTINDMDRKKWFTDRVGKHVYRNNTFCNCVNCHDSYVNGFIIQDKSHAEYLFDVECEYRRDGTNIEYFDTREDMLEYEKNLKRHEKQETEQEFMPFTEFTEAFQRYCREHYFGLPTTNKFVKETRLSIQIEHLYEFFKTLPHVRKS